MTPMQSILMAKANYMGPFAPGIYLQTIVKSWVVMASRLIWPLGLAPEYVVPVPDGWTDPWLLAAGLLLVFFVWALYQSWRHCRVAFWGFCWAVIFWGPVSNVVPLAYLAADRYLYLPLAGLALALVAVLPARLPRIPFLLMALILTGCLAGLSWQQVKVWKNPEALWTQAVKVSPESAFALNNLGNVYYQKNEWNQAVTYYQRAIRVNPSNPMAHYNLGIIFEQAGQVKQAIQHYQEFLRFDIPMYRQESQQLRLRLKERYGVWIGS
jgi:tetratricopeptide (TPR) repeat protein